MYHLHPFSTGRLFSRSLAVAAATGLLATCCLAAETPSSIRETTITGKNAPGDVPPTGAVDPVLQKLASASAPEQVEQLFAERRRVRITSLPKPPVPPAVEPYDPTESLEESEVPFPVPRTEPEKVADSPPKSAP